MVSLLDLSKALLQRLAAGFCCSAAISGVDTKIMGFDASIAGEGGADIDKVSNDVKGCVGVESWLVAGRVLARGDRPRC